MVSWLPNALRTPSAEAAVALLLLVAVASLVHLAARRYLLRLLRAVVKRTNVRWDGVLFEHRAPHRAALLLPALVIKAGLPLVPHLAPELRGLIERVVDASLILIAAATLDALFSAAHSLYLRLAMAGARPIKSYVQLAKVFLYVVAGIFVVASLADQSPWFFVSGLGAMMAVILLIFRDTLLSLVASVQLTNNDLIRVGDWIEMPQFSADGDVVDIALSAVKVVNWDKTITVIPTHKFLEHSFKNWRHMYGVGRRIKRSIFINTSTIRFLTPAEIEKLSRFALLRDYITEKLADMEAFNAGYADDSDLVVNQRRLTNIGTFRAYVTAYLRNHPMIHQDLTFLVRQLDPTPEGLPLQIYVFTTDTRWAVYEGIQADIFDHLLSIISEFGLSAYQRPSGGDFGAAALEEEIGVIGRRG